MALTPARRRILAVLLAVIAVGATLAARTTRQQWTDAWLSTRDALVSTPAAVSWLLLLICAGLAAERRWWRREAYGLPRRLGLPEPGPPTPPATSTALPPWAPAGGVALVATDAPSAQHAIALALAGAGCRVLAIGDPLAVPPSPAPGVENRAAPETAGALRAWLDRAPGAASAVVVGGAHSLAGAAPAERAEARIARFCEEARRSPLRPPHAVIFVEDRLPTDRLVDPDPVGCRMLGALDAVWWWQPDRRSETAVSVRRGGFFRSPRSDAPVRGRLVPLPGDRPGIAAWLVARGGWDNQNRSAQRWEARTSLVVALLATIAAALWAVVPSLLESPGGTVLLGSESRDLPGSLWVAAWAARWAAGEVPLLRSDEIYWPLGADLVQLYGNLLVPVLSVPFQWAWGYPDFWNRFAVVALTLNGLGAWALARQAGADRPGSVLAAVSFSLAPPVLAVLEHGAQSWFWAAPLPLALAAGLRAMDGLRPADGWLAGLALAMACLASWFYGFFAATLLAVAFAARWWLADPVARARLTAQAGRALRAWVPVFVTAGPLLAQVNLGQMSGYFFGGLPEESGGSQIGDRLVDAALRASVSPADLFFGRDGASPLPNLLLLGAIAFWVAGPGRRDRAWAWVVAGCAVLAAGPLVRSSDSPIDFLRLPYAAAAAAVPFLSRLHDPDRMLVLAAVAWSVILALLHRPIALRLPRAVAVAPLALGLGAVAAAPWLTGRLPVSTFAFAMPRYYSIIGDDEGAILEVPLGYSPAAAMYQPLHGHPIVGGPGEERVFTEWSPQRWHATQDPVLAYLNNPFQPLPDQASLTRSLQAGLRYVVVHNDIVDELNLKRPDAEADALRPLMGKIDLFAGPPLIESPGARTYRLPEEVTWPDAGESAALAPRASGSR